MENQVIKTPSGIEIKVKTTITGRIQREIDNVAISATSINVENNKPTVSSFDANVVRAIEDKTIELLVLEVDGKSEDILNLVLDLEINDYRFVLKKLDDVLKTGVLDNDKKK